MTHDVPVLMTHMCHKDEETHDTTKKLKKFVYLGLFRFEFLFHFRVAGGLSFLSSFCTSSMPSSEEGGSLSEEPAGSLKLAAL